MKILKTKVHRYGGKTIATLQFEVEEDRHNTKEEIQHRLERNAPWMAYHLINWADFDHSYSIELFIDSLKHLGKGLIRWNNAFHAKRNGRKALQAAAMLERAYNYHSSDDVSYKNWANRCPVWWKKIKSGSRMMRDYPYDNAMNMDREEYSDKMFIIIINRQRKQEETLKKEAWEFTHKHIEKWWD